MNAAAVTLLFTSAGRASFAVVAAGAVAAPLDVEAGAADPAGSGSEGPFPACFFDGLGFALAWCGRVAPCIPGNMGPQPSGFALGVGAQPTRPAQTMSAYSFRRP